LRLDDGQFALRSFQPRASSVRNVLRNRRFVLVKDRVLFGKWSGTEVNA
jgi:hypothetical protein